jgi:PHD/YefM family antitoxin component YafN of YafNO toxin-antitoxin module
MDKLPLALGITGTTTVVIAIVAYLISKGLKSKCLAAKMEMSFDIHRVKDNHTENEIRNQPISSLTRGELETMIVDIMSKHKHSTVTFSNAGNVVLPTMTPKQPSLSEIEEMIKETIHEVSHSSPATRSRSGSEDSHRSHKSYHSRGKEENTVILKEEV